MSVNIYTFVDELDNQFNNQKQTAMAKNTAASIETSRKVMNLAWYLRKTYDRPMSASISKAWKNIKLKKAMQNGIVEFHYEKGDGSIRQAFGTLNTDIVPALNGTQKKRAYNVQTYFDMERNDWRSFKKINLL